MTSTSLQRPGPRVAVAISGAGRSLSNLLDRQQDYSYQICGVIASSHEALGCAVALRHGLPLLVLDFSRSAREETTREVYRWLAEQRASWVALAGFLKMFAVMPAWKDRIVNIHPALLPKFGGKGMYGARVHAAVLAAQESVSGATVHFVNERYDEGQIIAQASVPVAAEDTPQSLAERVFAAECDLYPRTLSQLITQDLPLKRGKIWAYEFKI